MLNKFTIIPNQSFKIMSNWKMCRACLTSEETYTHNLYDKESGEMYMFCTSIDIREDENLPKVLCNTCYELLIKSTKFKKMCIQSQNTLTEVKFNSIKNEARYCGIIEPQSKNNTDMIKDEYCSDDKDSLNLGIDTHKDNKEDIVKDEYFSGHFDADYSMEADYENMTLKKRKTKKLRKKRNHDIKICKRSFNFTCELCNKKFIYLERFQAHKLEHEGKIVPIHCLPCNKTFVTWNGLKRHNKNEHTLVNLKSLKCSTCGKICKSQDTLKMHMKMHEERLLHVCDVCGKEFSTKIVLKAHLETHKENRERHYTCEHCGKKFYTNAILLSHVSRRHTGRRFICQICNYPFTQKYNLAKHMLIHEGKKLHECDICHKSYAAHSSLVEHKRIHSGERPFLCSYCPKSFLSRRRLNDHHRTHTGERPHKCDVCKSSFTQRGTLKRHMKVHDNPGPVIS